MLVLKQPPAIQSPLYDRAGVSQVLVLKELSAAQSLLCGRVGASANEELYKEVVPENGDIYSIKPQILREKLKKFPRNLEVKK